MNFDLLVIGGGSAGVRLARKSAAYGARVALVEAANMGGTCVYLGCVPKKMFYYAAGFSSAFADAEDYGWNFSDKPTLNWSALIKAKDAQLERLGELYHKTLTEAQVSIFKGKAAFLDDYRVEVLDQATGAKQIVSAKRFALTVGNRAFLPDIPGIDQVKTSNDIFSLAVLPETMLIVGSGYIAVEFACIFAALGVRVKLAYRSKRILKNFDEDVSDFITERMQNHSIELHPLTEVRAIRSVGKKYNVDCADGTCLQTDFVLYATGRVANTQGLGLENLSRSLPGKGGYIQVGDNFQTDIKHIYALGDVIGKIQLTPVAIAQANYLASYLFNADNHLEPPDYFWLPTAIFSRPSFASVGLSETDCVTQGIAAEIYVKVFTPLQHSLTKHREKEMIKLIVAKSNQRVLGLHMIGTEAPDIIQAVTPGLRKGLTKQDLESTLALHPISAEEILHFYPQHLARVI